VATHSAAALDAVLTQGDPAIMMRAHHTDEGYLNLDAIELTDAEIETACREIRQLLTNDI
jgi:hypothetical protein